MYENILLGFEFEIETKGQDNTYNFIDEASLITEYTKHCVYNYHSSSYRTIEGKWRVEEDNSILGAEFISPPMPYIKAKKMVKEFFEIMKYSNNIMVTDHCGLHVGMSINGTVNDLDLSSFLISLNQRYIASLWPERFISRYAKNIGEQIKKFKSPKNINIKNFASHLFHSNHTFISLKEFNYKKYLELRIPGGKDYHYKFKELFALIDYVANKMLVTNRPNLDPVAPTSKKCTKKIASYVNRMSKYNQDTNPGEFKVVAKRLNSGTLLGSFAFERILDLLITTIKYNDHEYIDEVLNKDLYLYSLVKYSVIHKKKYINDAAGTYTNSLLKLIEDLNLSISIPTKESTSNKIKLFKHWRLLPTSFLIELLASLDSKHAHKYLIRHVQTGILHALLSDSKGVLKEHAITHTFEYAITNTFKHYPYS